ncbi:hypothetical protein [Cohnella sp.]|uniref:hypothetical protein n=1 Tax=Cohnella sp. TaxID=1883426 RepID=UPI00356A79AB
MGVNKKRGFILFLGIMLVLSACSGGNNGVESQDPAQSSAPATSKANDDQVVDITFFASPSGNVIDLETNWFTQYVRDEFKLNVKFNVAPSSDKLTKQQLLLSSGNYPEVFWNGEFSPSDILKLSKQGIVVALNDYIDAYAPNLKKAIETAPGLKEAIVAPDGNIYGLTFYNACTHCNWGSKFWINTELLEKHSLTTPTTTEEFEHVLQVFKDNGYIPLSGTSDGFDPTIFLMNAFTYNNGSDYFEIKDGQVKYAPVEEGWKQGLAYMNRLYSKGLIDKQAFSQKSDVLKQLVSQNKVGVVPYLYSAGFIDTTHEKYSKWQTIAPLKGPEGIQYAAFSGNSPRNMTFIATNNATEDQLVRLMKLINFIYTPEGTQTLNYGPEGKYWTKATPDVKGLNGEQGLFITQSDAFYSANAKQNEGWDQMGPNFQDTIWRNGFVQANPPFSQDGLESLLMLETMSNYAGKQPEFVYPGAVWMESEDYQQYSLLKTNIENYVKQSMAQFIIGSKSTDKDWDSYLKGFEQLNLFQYLELAQKAMKAPFNTSAYKSDPQTVEFLSSLK